MSFHKLFLFFYFNLIIHQFLDIPFTKPFHKFLFLKAKRYTPQ